MHPHNEKDAQKSWIDTLERMRPGTSKTDELDESALEAFKAQLRNSNSKIGVSDKIKA